MIRATFVFLTEQEWEKNQKPLNQKRCSQVDNLLCLRKSTLPKYCRDRPLSFHSRDKSTSETSRYHVSFENSFAHLFTSEEFPVDIFALKL